MSLWEYEGYTKVKVGTGRRARYVETYKYKCPACGYLLFAERTALKPPRFCPSCKKDMLEGET